MKSLGKQNVLHSHYNGDILRKTWFERKTVYEKNDGTFWVNDFYKKVQAYSVNGQFEFSTRSYMIMKGTL